MENTASAATHKALKALSIFFLSLLIGMNFTSCVAGESDVYGVYETSRMEDVDKHLADLLERHREGWFALGVSSDVIYNAVSIDSDSLIFNTIRLSTISPYVPREATEDERKLICLFGTVIVEGLCYNTKRFRINSFEPVTNLDKQTQGSYPDGYKISCEDEDGNPTYLVIFKHAKDKGKVLITDPNELITTDVLTKIGLTGIGKNKFLTERSYTGTGKSAKSYISKTIDGYKKPVMEYKKVFEKESAEFAKRKEKERLEQEQEEREERENLTKECDELKKPFPSNFMQNAKSIECDATGSRISRDIMEDLGLESFCRLYDKGCIELHKRICKCLKGNIW